MPMYRFDDKVCVVSGGASGIGAKTAELYVAQGGRVVIGDLNRELGEELAERLGHDQAAYVALDITSQQACEQAIQEAVARFGAVDHLVNCALQHRAGPLAELPAESWRHVIDVGLTGTFFMCQAFGRWLLDNDRPGALVNVSSMAAIQPYGGAGAYSAVKAATTMLTYQLGIEWAGNGIRANTVAPGHILTPLTAYMQDPDIKRARSEATPIPRVGEPEDVAAGILYLLSDEASYVTAEQLVIDGGVTKSIFNHLPGRKFGGG
jgi:NAD(P)-dependent dehydrogenase (short-subunit alcohol dehydrogenase family)